MSGSMGPLETRPSMGEFPDTAALEAFDATPFSNGEQAFVVSTGETYRLVRSSTAAPDGLDVLSVGPSGAAGRWIRACFSCTGASGGGGVLNVQSVNLTTDETSVSPTLVDMPGMTLTLTTTGTRLLMQFTGSGTTNAQVASLISAFNLDGVVTGLNQGTETTFDATAPNGEPFALSYMKTGMTPGVHTVKMQWASTGPVIVAAASTAGNHATLTVWDLP